MPVRIGELLLKEKRITPDQLQQALNHQKANGGKLGYNLVKMGVVKDEEITALLSKQYGVPSINLTQFEIDPGVIKLIPADTATKYQIVPLSRAGATLTIAMTDPTNVFAMDDIKFMTGYNVEPVVASETAVLEAILKYYPAAAKVVAAMASAGLEGVARTTPDLASALETGEVSTVVLAQGELFPEALAPKLVPFVDRGGLLVALGGAPFRRPAGRFPDGGFVLRDESPIGGELRDDLRIEPAPCEGALALAVPPTAAELAALRGGSLEVAATFARRAGRPRQLQGIHRFEALLDGEREGARVGAVAVLVTYSADRKGALLLIGADGGGRIVDSARAQEIEAALHVLARKRHALASFVLPEEAGQK